MAKKILVVDDDPSILQMAALMLEIRKYETVTAVDGKQGVERAIELQPDLVLMDIRMPVMDGFQALKTIKANKDTAHIPIIYSTADASIDFEALPQDLKADDVLMKPYSLDQMFQKIEAFFSPGSPKN